MMKLLAMLGPSLFAAPLAAQTLTLPAPLTDKNGDGRVVTSRALPPFKRGDVLLLCPDQPRFTYALTCSAPAMASSTAVRGPIKVDRTVPATVSRAATRELLFVERIALRGPLRQFTGKQLWHNSYPAQPINGEVIERVRAICEASCIWIGRASTKTIVRDVELTRAGSSASNKIDSGIRVGGTKGGVPTAGVLVERVYSHGWKQNTTKGKYANGDGVAINRGVLDVTIRDSRFDDSADSGVDSKAAMLVLDNVSAAGNGHYGFRFWGGARATTLISRNNGWGHVEAEAGARVIIDKLIAEGPEELVTTNGPAEVEIKSCDLTKWTGTTAVKRQGKPLAKVTFGVGCRTE